MANVEFAIPSITPTYCAAYAIRKMEKRKIVIVPKNKMKVLAFISRVLPQSLVIRMSRTAAEEKEELVGFGGGVIYQKKRVAFCERFR